MTSFNYIYFILGVSIAFNFYNWFYYTYDCETKIEHMVSKIKDVKSEKEPVEQKNVEIKDSIEVFYKLASSLKTDNVTVYSYHYIYGTYLPRFRNKHVNFLEIGLGCGMPYGTGKSVELWKTYFPKITLHIMEYDAGCAEEFRSKVNKMYIGDQSNPKDLN